MDSKISLFSILAILCVLLSACAVSATDSHGLMGDQINDYYLDDSHDGHDGAIIPPDNTHDEARHAAGGDPYLDGSQDGHNGTIVPPDANHNEAAYLNATHAAGGDVNTKTTSSSPVNVTAQNTLHPTGNPILALFAVCAVLDGAAVVLRRK